MGTGVDIKIDQSIIKPIMEKQIAAAIIQNLGKEAELIEKMVGIVLSQKVDSEGKPPRYPSDGKYDYLEFMVKKGIQDAAQEAFREWLKESTDKIKQAVVAELKKPARQRTMANAFVDAIEKSLKCSWNMTCNVSFVQDRD